MCTKYESAFYYKNPEIQLIINLQRIRDELGALLHVDHCDRCLGLKCRCLDVATLEDTEVTAESATTADKNTDAPAELTAKDVTTELSRIANSKDSVLRMKDARPITARAKDANTVDLSTIPWIKDANVNARNWTKDVGKDAKAKESKWSFKFSPLNIEEDIWRRADRYRRPVEEKYLSSETVEEFFQSIKKRTVKCS